MRAWLLLVCLLPILCLLSCASSPVAAEQAGPDSLLSLSLRDVQGLFGGQNLWLRADGLLIVQKVATGQVEKRFELQLEPEIVAVVERLVLVDQPVANIEIPEHMGMPDEARPTLALTTRSGQVAEVAKWANDVHDGFDTIYASLLRLVQRAVDEGALIHEGPFDWDWRPEGF